MDDLVDQLNDSLLLRLKTIISISVSQEELEQLDETRYVPMYATWVLRMYRHLSKSNSLLFSITSFDMPEAIMIFHYKGDPYNPVTVLSTSVLQRLLFPSAPAFELVKVQTDRGAAPLSVNKLLTLKPCLLDDFGGLGAGGGPGEYKRNVIDRSPVLGKLLAVAGHAATHYRKYQLTKNADYEHAMKLGPHDLDALITTKPNEQLQDLLNAEYDEESID